MCLFWLLHMIKRFWLLASGFWLLASGFFYWFLRAPPAPGPPSSGDPAKTFLPSGSVIFPAFTVFVPSLARQPSTETMSPVFVRVHPLELRDLAFRSEERR